MDLTRKLLSSLLAAGMTMGTFASSMPMQAAGGTPYTDVNPSAYYMDGVKYLYDHHIMTGTTSTTFSPSMELSRGMMATILYRLEGSPLSSAGKFDDVPEWSYYAKPSAWANSAGIMTGNGTSTKTFDGEDPITRQDMALVLQRYANWKGTAGNRADISSYSDAGLVSDYALDGMKWAVSQKIITGKNNGTILDPLGTTSRAEAATMLERYLNTAQEENKPSGKPSDPDADSSDSSASPDGTGSSSGSANIPGGSGGSSSGTGSSQPTIGDSPVAFTEKDDDTIKGIIGDFTGEPVESKQDAADAMNSIKDRLGEDFEADPNEIASDTENGETVYFYSPVVENIPVKGSQVILTAGPDNQIRSLTSNYVDGIEKTDISNPIPEAEAEQAVMDKISAILIEDGIISDEDDLASYLGFKSFLEIHAGNNIYDPALVYEVFPALTVTSSETEPEEDEESTTISTALGSHSSLSASYYVYANGEKAGKIQHVEDHGETSKEQIRVRDVLGNVRTIDVDNITIRGKTRWQLLDKDRNINTMKNGIDLGLKDHPIEDNEQGIVAVELIPGQEYRFSTVDELDPIAVTLHANMGIVYDFYKDVLGRKSFDGKGKEIIEIYNYADAKSILHGDGTWNNAMFSRFFTYVNGQPSQMIERFNFGNGAGNEVCLDTLGHEFTHAVIFYRAGSAEGANEDPNLRGMEYSGQSGGLHESYADIMGSIIEGKDRSDLGRWVVGEQTHRPASEITEYGRNFFNPTHEPNSIDNFRNYYDGLDVHYSSGIFNHAAYLMIMDERTRSVSDEDWARIFYNSIRELGVHATFFDGAVHVYTAADAYLPDSFPNKDAILQAIMDAYIRVGIFEEMQTETVQIPGKAPDHAQGGEQEDQCPYETDANGNVIPTIELLAATWNSENYQSSAGALENFKTIQLNSDGTASGQTNRTSFTSGSFEINENNTVTIRLSGKGYDGSTAYYSDDDAILIWQNGALYLKVNGSLFRQG